MITSIVGNNRYLMAERLAKLVSSFEGKYGNLAIERIDADEASLDQINEAVSSLPFLAERKLVILKNLGLNKAAEEIEQIISSANTDIDVIIYDQITDKRTIYYKTLKSKTTFKEYQNVEPRDLANWLVDEAKNSGAELKLSDANYLIERVGSNQQLLAGEVQKLSIYEPKISRQAIDLLTSKNPQTKVFDLLDAAFSGNKQKALALYADQRTQRVEPQEIMAMLAWQLRLLVAASIGKEEQSSVIAKDLGLSPYPLSKAQNLVAKIGTTRLKELVNDAAEIDRKAKTSSIDLDEALKTYISTL